MKIVLFLPWLRSEASIGQKKVFFGKFRGSEFSFWSICAEQKFERNVLDAEALLKTGAILSKLSENKPNLGCCSKAFGKVCKGPN